MHWSCLVFASWIKKAVTSLSYSKNAAKHPVKGQNEPMVFCYPVIIDILKDLALGFVVVGLPVLLYPLAVSHDVNKKEGRLPQGYPGELIEGFPRVVGEILCGKGSAGDDPLHLRLGLKRLTVLNEDERREKAGFVCLNVVGLECTYLQVVSEIIESEKGVEIEPDAIFFISLEESFEKA